MVCDEPMADDKNDVEIVVLKFGLIPQGPLGEGQCLGLPRGVGTLG